MPLPKTKPPKVYAWGFVFSVAIATVIIGLLAFTPLGDAFLWLGARWLDFVLWLTGGDRTFLRLYFAGSITFLLTSFVCVALYQVWVWCYWYGQSRWGKKDATKQC